MFDGPLFKGEWSILLLFYKSEELFSIFSQIKTRCADVGSFFKKAHKKLSFIIFFKDRYFPLEGPKNMIFSLF